MGLAAAHRRAAYDDRRNGIQLRKLSQELPAATDTFAAWKIPANAAKRYSAHIQSSVSWLC